MGCLSENAVLELLEDPSAPAHAEARSHLAACDACRALVAALAGTSLLRSPEQVADGSEGAEPIVGGTYVGRYRIERPLGAGGMGVVYAAYDPMLERRVALKVLRPDRSLDELRDRLVGEAKVLARLSHPSVVAVFDVGVVGQQAYVAMELVEGTTLRAWLAEPRPADEIRRTLAQAGRGIAAAHAAGLIHRDIKPDNVLVGRDGRVRVADFGLARPVVRPSARPATVAEGAQGSEAAAIVTRAGVGTPAYMAPEQMMGRPVDARADVFAFAVTAYEALFGAKPFAGGTFEALLDAKLYRRVLEPPRGRVPAAVARALRRALDPDPAVRPARIDELVNRLEPAGSRRAAWGMAGLLVVSALSMGTLAHSLATKDGGAACEGAGAEISAVWSPARQQALREALLQGHAPYAEASLERVLRTLDGYANEWSAARVDACEARRLHGGGPARAARDACLDRRLEELDSLLSVLAHADPTTVRNAVHASRRLTPVQPCVAGRLPETVDPPTGEGALLVTQALARGKAMQAAGSFEGAEPVLLEARDLAAAHGAPALEAEALALLGVGAERQGRFERSQAFLEEAHARAIASRHDEVSAQALAELVYVVGYRRAQPSAGLSLARQASAVLQRIGGDERIEIALHDALAYVHRASGRYAEARGELEASVALAERALGPDHPDLADALVALGRVLADTDLLGESEATYLRAIAIQERALGPDHPSVAVTHRSLAGVEWRSERFAAAEARLAKAHASLVASLGADSFEVAHVLNQQGNVALAQAHFDEAVRHYRLAVKAGERLLGVDHPETAMARYNLAAALLGEGRVDEAWALASRSRASLEAAQAENPHYLGMVLSVLGDVERRRRGCPQAVELYRRALSVEEGALGLDHEALGEPLTGIGECLLAAGRARDAVPPLERALTVRLRGSTMPFERGRTRFALARALPEAERARAVDLATQAVEDLRHRPERQAEVRAWLGAR